ncbi:glycoside hydrolase family 25 protein [Pelomyxa schiedti]|nr:glycoside hydrolase family 25 protein [Pelomyxa schiedti]
MHGLRTVLLWAVVAISAMSGVARATNGVDVSTTITPDAASCMVSSSKSYAIARCWKSSGSFDSACVESSTSSWNAGMKHFDVYFFPCYGGNHPSCTSSTASTQMQQAIGNLTSNGVEYGMLWLDVEEPNGVLGQYWSTSLTENQQFFTSLVGAAKGQGVTIGVYTNKNMWTLIMGSSYTGGAGYGLWYAHYDDNPSFSDFVAFGGWTSPSIKQYQGTTTLCNTGVDLDWYP